MCQRFVLFTNINVLEQFVQAQSDLMLGNSVQKYGHGTSLGFESNSRHVSRENEEKQQTK